MRIAGVILLLAAIALTLVHIRRKELTVRHKMQRCRLQQVALRRKLWDQQVKLGYLAAPKQVHRRMEEVAFRRTDARDPLAQRTTDPRPTFQD